MSIRVMAAIAVTLHLASAGRAVAQPDLPLSLAEAILIAEHAPDPAIASWDARAAALEHRGRADLALPDPMIRVGIANLPVSDLDLNREAMTQTQIGVRQVIPRGDTRNLLRARRSAEADGARASGQLEAWRVRRAVRLSWLEVFYWESVSDLTRSRRQEIRQLSGVAMASFASGGGNSHDVIRVDLETALLDARLIEIDRQIGTARAQLSRYLGSAHAQRSVLSQLPPLPALPDETNAISALTRHPSVQMQDARIEVSQRGIDLALEEYRPRWSVDGGYGLRDSRSDVASVGVSVELPLFSRRRQNEGVASARELRSAEELSRQARLLDLRRQLDEDRVRHARLEDMANVYESDVLMRAQETSAAVLVAYENEQADFAEVVRSELALLDIEIGLLRTRVEALQAQSRILFLTGEGQ
jgi:cobalt-zinc-cadmium efflux system outer membrane protein